MKAFTEISFVARRVSGGMIDRICAGLAKGLNSRMWLALRAGLGLVTTGKPRKPLAGAGRHALTRRPFDAARPPTLVCHVLRDKLPGGFRAGFRQPASHGLGDPREPLAGTARHALVRRSFAAARPPTLVCHVLRDKLPEGFRAGFCQPASHGLGDPRARSPLEPRSAAASRPHRCAPSLLRQAWCTIAARALIGLTCATGLLPLAHAQPSYTAPAPVPTVVEDGSERRAGYLGRIQEVLTWRAALPKPETPASLGLAEIAAKLARREDAAACSARLIELMQRPSGDMFWMFPVTCISYLGRDQLTPEAKAAVREAWRTYYPLRGDTENHWVMYYTSLYLMAQLWPDEPGERWFNGKSSAEITREAREFLLHWIDVTTTIGQGEYDCTHYIGEYAIPMLYLATWAKDPAMRLRGRMMLDYVLADFAVETLNGIYIGSHARTDDITVLEKWNSLSSFFAWLFFNNCPPPASYGGWGLYFAAAAENYELPEVIYRIATDRSGPYTHYERKRTRHRWRNSDERNAPVYKTTYVTSDYAVGSDQGGVLQPIQQHSWDLTWAAADPRGVHNTIFSVQPYYGAHELMMYFTEMPDSMPAAVTFQGKPTYISEGKLLGGSPFEQIFQQDDAVVVLCDIPPGTHHEQVNGFFSKDLARMEEDASGWIFAQGGRAYLAYRPLAGYEWVPLEKGGKRLRSPHRQNGTILQAASESEFRSWEEFKAAIRALPLHIELAPSPRVTFTTLRGRKLECAYGAAPRVDGRVIDHAKEWKLFAGPYLNADVGSRKLTLTHGPLKRVLDFNTLTVTDTVHE